MIKPRPPHQAADKFLRLAKLAVTLGMEFEDAAIGVEHELIAGIGPALPRLSSALQTLSQDMRRQAMTPPPEPPPAPKPTPILDFLESKEQASSDEKKAFFSGEAPDEKKACDEPPLTQVDATRDTYAAFVGRNPQFTLEACDEAEAIRIVARVFPDRGFRFRAVTPQWAAERKLPCFQHWKEATIKEAQAKIFPGQLCDGHGIPQFNQDGTPLKACDLHAPDPKVPAKRPKPAKPEPGEKLGKRQCWIAKVAGRPAFRIYAHTKELAASQVAHLCVARDKWAEASLTLEFTNRSQDFNGVPILSDLTPEKARERVRRLLAEAEHESGSGFVAPMPEEPPTKVAEAKVEKSPRRITLEESGLTRKDLESANSCDTLSLVTADERKQRIKKVFTVTGKHYCCVGGMYHGLVAGQPEVREYELHPVREALSTEVSTLKPRDSFKEPGTYEGLVATCNGVRWLMLSNRDRLTVVATGDKPWQPPTPMPGLDDESDDQAEARTFIGTHKATNIPLFWLNATDLEEAEDVVAMGLPRAEFEDIALVELPAGETTGSLPDFESFDPEDTPADDDQADDLPRKVQVVRLLPAFPTQSPRDPLATLPIGDLDLRKPVLELLASRGIATAGQLFDELGGEVLDGLLSEEQEEHVRKKILRWESERHSRIVADGSWLDEELAYAAFRLGDAPAFWAGLRERGATDAELRDAINKRFFVMGGAETAFRAGYYFVSGPAPAFFCGAAKPKRGQEPALEGKHLVDAVRRLLAIPTREEPAKAPAKRKAVKA